MRKNHVRHEVTVSFDAEVCQHSGNCVRGLPAVFDVAKRPWIQPDNAPAADVIEVVGRCPSGALRIESRAPAAEANE
jgi:uncharacterized Fe-S cluster protein YjdI